MSNVDMKHILILITLAVVVLVPVTFFWHWAELTAKSFKEVQVSASNVHNGSEQKLNNMRKEVKALNPYVDKLSGVSMYVSDIPVVLNNIEALGSDSVEVTIENINRDNNTLASIAIAFTCELERCVKIVSDIANFRRVVGVDTINMRLNSDSTWDTTMGIQIPIRPTDQNKLD